MSNSPSPTVADILAGLGITTLAGDIVIGGVRSLSTTVGVAIPIQTLMVIDTGATQATTATATLTTSANPLTIKSGVQGSVEISPDGRTVTFSGTLSEINADLGLLSYASASACSDSVTLDVTDQAGNSQSGSFGINVLPGPVSAGAPTSASYVQPTSNGQNATLSGANQVYTADNKTDIVAATGTASTVTGGGAGSSLTLVQNGGSYDFTNKAGSALLVANAAPGTITGGGAGSRLVAFLNNQPATYLGNLGNDELIGGSGGMTVNAGGGGSLVVFGGAGSLQFQGGRNDAETVVGGAGAETIYGAASGGAYYAGSGGSQIFATGAGTFLVGAVNGDVLTSSALGGDMLVAGAGNETLNGSASAGVNILYGGTGSDTVMLGAGNDTYVGGTGTATIQMGSGSAAIFAGAGAMLLRFDASNTSGASGPGSDIVGGFRVGIDHLSLSGGLSVAGYDSGGSTTSLTLNNGTRIDLVGVSGATQTTLFG
jgi:Ca2+-binding RTX toxin-like protein